MNLNDGLAALTEIIGMELPVEPDMTYDELMISSLALIEWIYALEIDSDDLFYRWDQMEPFDTMTIAQVYDQLTGEQTPTARAPSPADEVPG